MNKILKLVMVVGLLAGGLGRVEGAGYTKTYPKGFPHAIAVLNVLPYDIATHATVPEYFVPYDFVLEDLIGFLEPLQVSFARTATSVSITDFLAELGDNQFPLEVSFHACGWLTDADLQAFVVGTNGMIVKLNLCCTNVTNISALANCTDLQSLDLDGTGVTATDISALKFSLPGLKIIL